MRPEKKRFTLLVPPYDLELFVSKHEIIFFILHDFKMSANVLASKPLSLSLSLNGVHFSLNTFGTIFHPFVCLAFVRFIDHLFVAVFCLCMCPVFLQTQSHIVRAEDLYTGGPQGHFSLSVLIDAEAFAFHRIFSKHYQMCFVGTFVPTF